jgi:hypothetical protein
MGFSLTRCHWGRVTAGPIKDGALNGFERGLCTSKTIQTGKHWVQRRLKYVKALGATNGTT